LQNFLWAEIACGDFSGHHFFSAGKKRGFCPLRRRTLWGVISADIARLLRAKGVVFVRFGRRGAVGAISGGHRPFAGRQKAWLFPARGSEQGTVRADQGTIVVRAGLSGG
jgi:hypothetical protein